MLQLKVCGMREPENLAQLIAVEPNFIGFIFHEKSPRNVDNPISIKAPKNIRKVGVFVDQTESFILEKIQEFQLEFIQLHGNESPHFCKKIKALKRKVIKAFNLHDNFNFQILENYTPYCDYFLFDAFGEQPGGNGITFNWKLLDRYKGEIPFLLSGGIDENMVPELTKISHPMFAGIDINSKFETKPGIKNIEKIKAFKNELYS